MLQRHQPLVVLANLLLLATLLPASPASAQWSVTAFLGRAATSSTALELGSRSARASLVVEPVSFDDESFQSPWYYGVGVERRFVRASWLGVEGELIHAKAIADTSRTVHAQGRFNGADVNGLRPLSEILPHFELSHGLNFVLGNAVVHWPALRDGDIPPVAIAGRVGAGVTVPHVEAVFLGDQENEYQLAGLAVAGAIGAEIRVSSHLSAIVDLKITRTRPRVSVGSSEIEGTFTTRHVVAGLAWRSRPRATTRS